MFVLSLGEKIFYFEKLNSFHLQYHISKILIIPLFRKIVWLEKKKSMKEDFKQPKFLSNYKFFFFDDLISILC